MTADLSSIAKDRTPDELVGWCRWLPLDTTERKTCEAGAVELARRLEEAQQKIVAQEADVRNIINRIPAIVNGEMIIDHYNIEGEFVGSESVDPLAVLGSVVGALEAMDYAALAAHDAELTAKAKAVALEEAINKCFDMTLYTGFDCAIALEEMAAEYRAKPKGE